MSSPDTKEDVLNNNFEKIFKTMMLAMKIIKFQPYLKKDVKWAVQFCTMYGMSFMIFCLLIYSMIFHDLRTNDIAQACANGILSIIFGVLTFQYCAVFYYHKIIEEMIEKMNNDYKNAKQFPKDEQQCVIEHIKKGKFVITIWLLISICGASLFILKAISLMLYYTIFDEFKYVHIYDLTYPDSVEEIKNTFGPYCIINFVFTFYDIYVMFMFIGFAPMGPIFLLHACGQLEIAKTRIMKIFQQDNTTKDIDKNLKEIAELLVEVYRFINKINVAFMVLYELTLKTTTIVLPITFYQIIESSKNGKLRIEFICVIIGGMTMSSVPCYYSDKLMESGEKLRRAIYMCGWEKRWNQKSRTLILLLLLRTTPSVTIRTMFCPLCLDTLADVFHQAYAIFSVLNAACN